MPLGRISPQWQPPPRHPTTTYTVAELEPVNVPELQDKVRLNTVRLRCWAEGIIAGLNLLDWHVREYPIKEPEDLRGVVTTLEAMFDSGRLAEDAWGISACAVEALVGDTLISALVIQAKALRVHQIYGGLQGATRRYSWPIRGHAPVASERTLFPSRR